MHVTFSIVEMNSLGHTELFTHALYISEHLKNLYILNYIQ